MRDILPDLDLWFQTQDKVALATVISTWGSSPRQIGAQMAVSSTGEISGSVSGGCVEGAVIEEAFQAIKTGIAKLLKFGVGDETAWEVGLACGGEIEVFIQALDPELFAQMRETLVSTGTLHYKTLIQGPETSLGKIELLSSSEKLSPNQFLKTELKNDDEKKWFWNFISPPPHLIIVGGGHISQSLAIIAKTLNFKISLIDPRGSYSTESRFPDIDEIYKEWPDTALDKLMVTNNTAFAILTHDPKIDDPALIQILRSPAFYIGALGSKTTQEKRKKRLLNEGFLPKELERIKGPIGLNISAVTPVEIAVAIAAEIILAKNTPRK